MMNLSFKIDGHQLVNSNGSVRPASTAEIEAWNLLAKLKERLAEAEEKIRKSSESPSES
jgi:hypothetical protein